MEDERKKWNKYEFDEALEEGKKEFIALERQLHELVVKFCLRALKSFQKSKNEPLNPLQIDQIIEHEIGLISKDVRSPNFMDITVKRVKLEWEGKHHDSKE